MNNFKINLPIVFVAAGFLLVVLILFFPSKDPDINKAILGIGGSGFSIGSALATPSRQKQD